VKIDAFPHILPRRYFDRMIAAASGPASYMQKRTAGVPCLYDLDERFRVMDRFEGYVQVLTLSSPPVEALGEPALTRDLARLANDEMADLVRRYPDRFLGFAASLPMNDPDAAVREAERATSDLDALGVQIYTNVNGLPLDDPRFEPLFARMAELDRAIWVHPARIATMPDYASENRSKYELWWVFGWPYETAIFMSRLIFSGHLDRYPNLRILTHHAGGMVPHFAGRIGPGLDQLGARDGCASVRSTITRCSMGTPRSSAPNTPFVARSSFSASTTCSLAATCPSIPRRVRSSSARRSPISMRSGSDLRIGSASTSRTPVACCGSQVRANVKLESSVRLQVRRRHPDGAPASAGELRDRDILDARGSTISDGFT